MLVEQSLILLKPDTVQRNLIGKIITRFEDAGLKIAAMKMVWPNEERAKKHYHLDETWAKNVFEKAKTNYSKEGKVLPYKDHMEMGQSIQSQNMAFLKEGPVVAVVLQGPHAIEVVRKMIGSTEPRQALPGTIRGDFATLESYPLSDSKKRVMRNLVHASDSVDNAKREISLWFSPEEVHNYQKDLDKHF